MKDWAGVINVHPEQKKSFTNVNSHSIFLLFQTPSIILDTHSTGLPRVNTEQILHADMFWTNAS